MKAYTKGAKRRVKKLAGVADLEEIPKRRRDGKRRQTTDAPRDPRKTVLEARCRQMGLDDTQKNKKAASAPHIGCQVGKVMDKTLTAAETARRWKAFEDMLGAEAAYFSRYIGQGQYPRSAAMQMVRERFEVEESTRIDLRTEEEKARAAVNSWMAWQGILGHLSSGERIAIDLAKRDTFELWDAATATPTRLGLASCEALGRLADIAERKR